MADTARLIDVKRVNDMRSPWLAVLGASLAVVVAGCGAEASRVGNPSGASATVGTGTSLRHPLTPEQVAAVLVAGARVPAGATEVSSSPMSSLARPPSVPEVSGRLERMRWWRIDEPAATVYAAVAHSQSPSLTAAGSSSAHGPILSDNVKAADFEFRSIPQSVHAATFSIAVAPLTSHTSAIGAYSIVVKQPPRLVTENVPTTVRQVVLAQSTPTLGADANGPTASKPVTVSGAAAERLVTAFDGLRAQPVGVTSCPAEVSAETATFTYDGHTLVATIGACGGVFVTLDHRSLPLLYPSPAFTRDVMRGLHHS